MNSRNQIFLYLDWGLIFLYLLLLFIGWGTVYSASYDENFSGIFDLTQKHGKQLIILFFGLFMGSAILFINVRWFYNISGALYILALLSLVGLFLFGKEISGATSWYVLGGASFQPSELCKVCTALFLARYISDSQVDIRNFKYFVKALMIVLLPMALIIPQPDPGSALTFLSFLLVFYREGMSGYIIFLGILMLVLFVFSLILNLYVLIGIIILLFVYFFFKVSSKKRLIFSFLFITMFTFSVQYIFNNVLADRHRDRIHILLGIIEDNKGVGYNTYQSKLAIASGELKGKGFLEGTHIRGGFIPEQTTDFIFCVLAEEWGFLGSASVVLLYCIFLIRLIFIAERQKSKFSRVFAYGVASILWIHFFINIGMTIGLVPVIGIPLPFFSYGGSALWSFALLIFILLKLDANRVNEL